MEEKFMHIVILSLAKKLNFKTSQIKFFNLKTNQSSYLRNNQVKEGKFFQIRVVDLELVLTRKKISSHRQMAFLMNC